MSTRWAPLSWLDARYEVSTEGQVRSWADSHGGRRLAPRLLKLQKSTSGYLQARLPHGSGFKWFSVHRLVLRAFEGGDGQHVNHKNGVKTDNRVANLEWSSASENLKHAYRVLGLRHHRATVGRTGVLCSNSKPVVQKTLEGEVIRVWDAIADARRAGFSAGNISAVCRGERLSHAGFKWSFSQS